MYQVVCSGQVSYLSVTEEQKIGDNSTSEIAEKIFSQLYQLARPYQSIRGGPIGFVMGNVVTGGSKPESKMLLNKYCKAML